MANLTAGSKSDTQGQLRDMAEDVMTRIAMLDGPASMEQLLGEFVSELFFAAARDRQQKERRQRQAEGIAAAKAKGVHFGAARKPLPAGFESSYRAWRDGEITLTAAAESCGMVRTSFKRAIKRMEEDAGYPAEEQEDPMERIG